jgi:hypothetical protein
MYELFVFQTLVDREAPNVEQEPVTMIQYDQQSRWKVWMRMLAVDIRPISISILRKPTSFSTGVTRPGVSAPRAATVVEASRVATGPYSACTWD